MKYGIIVLILCIVTLDASARLQIRSVGSSTIAPLTQDVVEAFVKETHSINPLLTSNGTGMGIKSFCSGADVFKPDIVSASRPMTKNELDVCFKNGVKNLKKVLIGKTGLCFLHSQKALIDNKITTISLTPAQIFTAVIKDIPTADGKLIPNTHQKWNEIDPALPKAPIQVLLPPTWHGTRKDFETMVLENACDQIPWVQSLKTKDPQKYEKICHSVRTDSHIKDMVDYELADDANVLISNLASSPLGTIGVIGCNVYMLHPKTRVVPLAVNKITPSPETLKNGSYPLIYTLQMYWQADHFKTTDGLEEFFKFYTSPKIIGPNGLLSKRGIIPVEAGDNPITEVNPQNPQP